MIGFLKIATSTIQYFSFVRKFVRFRQKPSTFKHFKDSKITFRYCTEEFIKLKLKPPSNDQDGYVSFYIWKLLNWVACTFPQKKKKNQLPSQNTIVIFFFIIKNQTIQTHFKHKFYESPCSPEELRLTLSLKLKKYPLEMTKYIYANL